MLAIFGVVFASLGAALILFALTFVSLLIGVIITAMIILTSGQLIDGFARKRGLTNWLPGDSR
jgi:predicted butyrate kinase (DUF1464 family)